MADIAQSDDIKAEEDSRTAPLGLVADGGEITMSTETNTQNKLEAGPVPCICSQRWILAYVGLFGCMCLYAMRVNLSMAMICMVKDFDVGLNSSKKDNFSYDSNETVTGCQHAYSDKELSFRAPEFDWDKTMQSSLLASYFYGSVVTQIPGGWLSARYGGKRVLGLVMLVSAVGTLLFPICTRTSVYLAIALRVVLGLAGGIWFPAFHSMWGRWAPVMESTKLTAFAYSGNTIGMIVTFAGSGFLCAYGFDNGWGSVFYVTGAAGLIWVAAWFYLTAESPDSHPRITDSERIYIKNNIGFNAQKKQGATPWAAILTSPATWGVLTAHFASNWTFYTLLTLLPTFLKEVLKFDITQNGLLSTLPYISQTVSSMSVGLAADYLRSRQILSTAATRRTCQSVAFVGTGSCLIVVGFIPCEQRGLTILFLALSMFFLGLSFGGFIVNHVDFAPRYAGVIFGITNGAATIPGMVAPLVAGALTPNKTQEEWRNVFYICAGMDVIGTIVFGALVRGEIQPWAKDPDLALPDGQYLGNKVLEIEIGENSKFCQNKQHVDAQESDAML